jgi:hypothetical protein
MYDRANASIHIEATMKSFIFVLAIVDGGKKFHVPGCRFMHGKYHMVTPEEAVREGYTPCTRCMRDAVRSAGNVTPDFEGEERASSATVEE